MEGPDDEQRQQAAEHQHEEGAQGGREDDTKETVDGAAAGEDRPQSLQAAVEAEGDGDVNLDKTPGMDSNNNSNNRASSSSFASASSGQYAEASSAASSPPPLQLAPAAPVDEGVRSSYASTLDDKLSTLSLDNTASKNTSLTSTAPSEIPSKADDDASPASNSGDRPFSLLPAPETPSAPSDVHRDSLLKRQLDAHARDAATAAAAASAASAPLETRWRDSTTTGMDTVALSDSAGSQRSSVALSPLSRADRLSAAFEQQAGTSSEAVAGPSTPPASTHENRSSKLISPSRAVRKSTASSSSHNYDMIQQRAEAHHHDLEENPKRHRRTLRGSEDLRANFAKLREELGGGASPAPGESHVSSHEQRPESSSPAHDEAAHIDWDFWGEVMSDYEGIAKTRPKDLSKAIQNGIPPALRGMMWQLMSASKDPELEATYSQLMRLPSPHEKAIIRDLNRTFPTHEYFHDKAGVGQGNLLNIMKAYSIYDDEVGYCQGMAFVVGPLLLNMPDEEAFCVLVRLMKSYDLRTQYVPDMPGLQLRLYQFDRLLEELLPALFMHLLRQGIKSSMYASQWFLTLLAYRFPLELVCSVFDLIFAEGVEAIFRFALAVMKRNEHRLVELEFEHLLEFLKTGLFEHYKNQIQAGADNKDQPTYSAQAFVKEALQVKITPMMLDQYTNEWTEMCKQQNAQSAEVEQLRAINKKLSNQVRHLEGSLAQINQEHCELVKQVVATRLEKEELEDELVRVKMALAQESLLREEGRGSIASRSSFASFTSSNGPKSPDVERRESQLSLPK